MRLARPAWPRRPFSSRSFLTWTVLNCSAFCGGGDLFRDKHCASTRRKSPGGERNESRGSPATDRDRLRRVRPVLGRRTIRGQAKVIKMVRLRVDLTQGPHAHWPAGRRLEAVEVFIKAGAELLGQGRAPNRRRAAGRRGPRGSPSSFTPPPRRAIAESCVLPVPPPPGADSAAAAAFKVNPAGLEQ